MTMVNAFQFYIYMYNVYIGELFSACTQFSDKYFNFHLLKFAEREPHLAVAQLSLHKIQTKILREKLLYVSNE